VDQGVNKTPFLYFGGLQIASSGSPVASPSVSSATSIGDSNKPDRLRAINRTYHLLLTEDVGHKIWSALPIIMRVMNRVGCLFDKAAIFF
jgi:hypothetical protein